MIFHLHLSRNEGGGKHTPERFVHAHGIRKNLRLRLECYGLIDCKLVKSVYKICGNTVFHVLNLKSHCYYIYNWAFTHGIEHAE